MLFMSERFQKLLIFIVRDIHFSFHHFHVWFAKSRELKHIRLLSVCLDITLLLFGINPPKGRIKSFTYVRSIVHKIYEFLSGSLFFWEFYYFFAIQKYINTPRAWWPFFNFKAVSSRLSLIYAFLWMKFHCFQFFSLP